MKNFSCLQRQLLSFFPHKLKPQIVISAFSHQDAIHLIINRLPLVNKILLLFEKWRSVLTFESNVDKLQKEKMTRDVDELRDMMREFQKTDEKTTRQSLSDMPVIQAEIDKIIRSECRQITFIACLHPIFQSDLFRQFCLQDKCQICFQPTKNIWKTHSAISKIFQATVTVTVMEVETTMTTTKVVEKKMAGNSKVSETQFMHQTLSGESSDIFVDDDFDS